MGYKWRKRERDLSSSLRRLISSSSRRWRQVPSDLIFSKCCFTSSRHSAWWEHVSVNQLCLARADTEASVMLYCSYCLMHIHVWTFLVICGVYSDRELWRRHTWDLKYVSWGVDSTSADAISRWRRIWRKEGLFLGLQFLQIQNEKDSCVHLQWTVKSIKSLNPQTCCAHYSSLFVPTVHFQTFAHQHCLRRILKPSGQLSGMGSCRLLFPTPHMMADESTSLYGISPVSISHSTTPNDLKVKLSFSY